MRLPTWAVCSLLLVACGGSKDDSDDDTDPVVQVPLIEVEETGWQEVCEDVAAGSVEQTITCPDFELTIPAVTVEECVAANADLWVGDCTLDEWVACQEYVPADPCDPMDLGPCAALYQSCLPTPD